MLDNFDRAEEWKAGVLASGREYLDEWSGLEYDSIHLEYLLPSLTSSWLICVPMSIWTSLLWTGGRSWLEMELSCRQLAFLVICIFFAYQLLFVRSSGEIRWIWFLTYDTILTMIQ